MNHLIKLQIVFLVLMILFASLSLWYEGSTLDILFRILAGVFVVLVVGIIVFRSWKTSQKHH